MWCEQQLAELVGTETVCGVLCQAHLYDAKQLEEECLSFIRENSKTVCVAPSFGALGEWPAVLVKVNHYLAGVEPTEAAPAIEAATATARKAKRRRDDDEDNEAEAAERRGDQ